MAVYNNDSKAPYYKMCCRVYQQIQKENTWAFVDTMRYCWGYDACVFEVSDCDIDRNFRTKITYSRNSLSRMTSESMIKNLKRKLRSWVRTNCTLIHSPKFMLWKHHRGGAMTLRA